MKTILSILLVLYCLSAKGVELPDGVLFREFEISDTRNTVWIYLPADYAEKKLPCVLIPPAGSSLYHGMGLSEGDRSEHLPYVKAGFAVVAFEISGSLSGGEATFDEQAEAISAFRKSKGGVFDGAKALKFAVSQVKSIDATSRTPSLT